MTKRIIVVILAFLACLFLAQMTVCAAESSPVDTLIVFTPTDVAAAPDKNRIYLTNNQGCSLVEADLSTGDTKELPLPNPPNKVVFANGKVFVSLATPAYGSDAVAVVDPDTFTVLSTLPVALDINGIAADAQYIYVYSNNTGKLEAYDQTTGVKASSLDTSQLYDLKCNPVDGKLYAPDYSGSVTSYQMLSGSLSFFKKSAKCSATKLTVMPDGKAVFLNNGYILSCDDNAADALTVKTRLTASVNLTCTDETNNELYVVSDRLIQVYDASTFATKRVLAQTQATNYLLAVSDNLIVGEMDSTNNLVFRSIDSGALLTSLKIDGDAISEVYPLHFAVEGGEVPNSCASVNISAETAGQSTVVSGDIGDVPLSVGKNTLSVSVKNNYTGRTQTYPLTIYRMANNPPAPSNDGLTNLGFIPLDFAVDPDRPVAYMTAADGYSLYRMDLATGAFTEKRFSLPAERLTVKNGNVYVTLLRTGHQYTVDGGGYGYGAVAVVDTATFHVQTVFNTNIDPFDIEADESGNVYLAPGSSQSSILASYNGKGSLLSIAAYLYQKSWIDRNPVSGKIYSITTQLSPRDISAYEVSNGYVTSFTDSPYHGDYDLSTFMRVSPDGKYIYNGAGFIFTSSSVLGEDMRYCGSLGATFGAMCFDLGNDTIYTASDKTLNAFGYTDRKIRYSYMANNSIVNLAMSGTRLVLVQKNSNLQYYVSVKELGGQTAELSAIEHSAGTLYPAFDKNTLDYFMVVPADADSVLITPRCGDSNTVSIDGAAVPSKTLSVAQGGYASVQITVKSQNSSVQKTYSVRVYRQAADKTFVCNSSFLTPKDRLAFGGATYLTESGKANLFKIDAASGTVQMLTLPGTAQHLGNTQNSILVTAEDTLMNRLLICQIDPSTFTVTGTAVVDTRYIGVSGDADYIYAYTSSQIDVYSRSDFRKVYTKTSGTSILDVKPNPANSRIYVSASNAVSSYRMASGVMQLVKSNTNVPGKQFIILSDGLHLVLSGGTVLACSSTAAYDLVVAASIGAANSFAQDSARGELYTYDHNLIRVYGADDFQYRRTIPETANIQYLMASDGYLFAAQKNRQGNIQIRPIYTGALLQTLKINGEPVRAFYPLQSAVDAGEVPSTMTSVVISATACSGAAVTGDTGSRPLSVGKNTFTITVSNTSAGVSMSYTVTITRRSSDPALSPDARANLGFTPLGYASDPDNPFVYMTADKGKSVYRVNLQTGEITEKQFDVYATRLAFSNGKIYAALQCNDPGDTNDNFYCGAVAVIDAGTMKTQTIFHVDMTPFDIAADANGIVYVSSSAGQYMLGAYSSTDGKKISSKSIYYTLYLHMNAAGSKIYMTQPYSSSQMIAHETADGVLGEYYYSPYNAAYSVSSYQRMSPDGTAIFNGSGAVFACKAGRTGDMEYFGTLGQAFTSICFDVAHDRFYTASVNKLTVYSYSSRKALNTMTFKNNFAHLEFVDGKVAAIQSKGTFYTQMIPADTLLSSIKAGDTAITGFDPLVHDYSISLQAGVSAINIAAAAFDPDSVVSGATGTQTLVNGLNVLEINVAGASGRTETYTLRVNATIPNAPVTGVSLDKPTMNLHVGQAAALKATVLPSNAGNKSVSWDSSNPEIASVSNGTVTGTAPGDATITVTTTEGGFAAQCRVTVSNITVTYDSRGGNAVPAATAAYNSTILRPASPVRTGFTFAGWYREAACTTAWNFATDRVTDSITLYAKWTAPAPEYAVSAVPNNVACGTVAGVGSYKSGTTVTLKAVPKAGYRFVRWLEGSAAVSASSDYTFTVTKARTLIAEFASIGTPAVKAASAGYGSVSLTWSSIPGAKEYEVYRAASAISAYARVGVTAGNAFTNTGLTTGTIYYYRVRAKAVAGTVATYGGYSAAVAARPIPAAPASAKAVPASYNSILVTWGAVAGATKYEVYRALSAAGAYALVSTSTTPSCTNTGVNTGTVYYYKVRAYRLVGAAKVYGGYSASASAKTALAVPASVKATKASSASIKVTWGAVPGATKYEVWRSTSSSGVYSLIAATGNNYYTNTGLAANRTYYYKVRAYRLVGSVKVYGGYSAVVYVKLQ